MSLTIKFKKLYSRNFRKKILFLFSILGNKRGVEYSDLQVTVATSFIFDYLKLEWIENNWDVRELQYLCLAMDTASDELNPNNFAHCRFAYLEELKNYYIKNNG